MAMGHTSAEHRSELVQIVSKSGQDYVKSRSDCNKIQHLYVKTSEDHVKTQIGLV